jgi:hypothetical protein
VSVGVATRTSGEAGNPFAADAGRDEKRNLVVARVVKLLIQGFRGIFRSGTIGRRGTRIWITKRVTWPETRAEGRP